MRCKTRIFFSFCIFWVMSVPSLLKAQGNEDGNHCAVKKSPYKLSIDSGKTVYVKRCLSCHQADGMGTLADTPSLQGKEVMGDKKKLIEILIRNHPTGEGLNGRTQ